MNLVGRKRQVDFPEVLNPLFDRPMAGLLPFI
jgi:hypothetical protein